MKHTLIVNNPTALIILPVFFVMFCTQQLVAGDVATSPRMIGMARASTASSRGLDAVGLNPANLALDDRGSTVTFQILPLGFKVGSFLTLGVYQDLFTGEDSAGVKRVGRTLTEADKNELLNSISGDLAYTNFNFDVMEFGFSVRSGVLGGIGFTVAEHAAANIDLPKDYLRFALDLFPEGASYNLNNTAIKASWTRNWTFSYARMLPVEIPHVRDLSVGIGLKYVQGLAYFGTDHYRGSISNPSYYSGPNQLDSVRVVGSFDFLQLRSTIADSNIVTQIMKPAGTGFGFDLGASAEVYQALRVGISVTDIGKINWTKNTKAIVASSQITVKDVFAEQDTLKRAFKGEQFDTTAFTTSLPTVLHIGAAFQVDEAPFVRHFPGRLLLAADFHFGFNNEPGNTTVPRFDVGAEYRPIGFFPIRTGISLGGRDGFGWAFGFGFNTPIWDFDFASQNIGGLVVPRTVHNLSLTLGMRWRI